MSTYELIDQVVDVVTAATGRPCGLGVVPTPQPTGTFNIVTYGGGPRPTGDMGSRTANRDRRFVVRSVGADEREVQWLKDKAFDALSAPDSLSDTQWAYLEVDSAIVPDGETLYSSTDTYIVRV